MYGISSSYRPALVRSTVVSRVRRGGSATNIGEGRDAFGASAALNALGGCRTGVRQGSPVKAPRHPVNPSNFAEQLSGRSESGSTLGPSSHCRGRSPREEGDVAPF